MPLIISISIIVYYGNISEWQGSLDEHSHIHNVDMMVSRHQKVAGCPLFSIANINGGQNLTFSLLCIS